MRRDLITRLLFIINITFTVIAMMIEFAGVPQLLAGAKHCPIHNVRAARAAFIGQSVGRRPGFLSVAAAHSFAASLLSLPISNTNTYVDSEPPLLSDVLADSLPAWGELWPVGVQTGAVALGIGTKQLVFGM